MRVEQRCDTLYHTDVVLHLRKLLTQKKLSGWWTLFKSCSSIMQYIRPLSRPPPPYLGLSLAIFLEISGNVWQSFAISGNLGQYLAISGYLCIFLSSTKYQGASRNRREQLIAIWNFFVIYFFFFSRMSSRGAHSPKDFKKVISTWYMNWLS